MVVMRLAITIGMLTLFASCGGSSGGPLGDTGAPPGPPLDPPPISTPPLPDLIPISIVSGTTWFGSNVLVIGHEVVIGFTVQNVGQGTAVASMQRAFLSTDVTLSEEDDVLGDAEIEGMPPGWIDNSAVLRTVMRASRGPGTYWLISQIDVLDDVPETNEGNNVGTGLPGQSRFTVVAGARAAILAGRREVEYTVKGVTGVCPGEVVPATTVGAAFIEAVDFTVQGAALTIGSATAPAGTITGGYSAFGGSFSGDTGVNAIGGGVSGRETWDAVLAEDLDGTLLLDGESRLDVVDARGAPLCSVASDLRFP